MHVRPYAPADCAERLRMRRALWPEVAIESEAADAAEWLARAGTVVLVEVERLVILRRAL